jgi:glycosyltransferase involved in cell wall biosynthesis
MSFFDIIMPTHGRPYLLQRAIKSIRRQKFDDVRLIIISDDPYSHSLHSIQGLLKPHDLFIQRFHATGPSASRNEGLKHITAQFVLFLDDDDSYAPNFLEDLYEALKTAQGDVFAVDFDVAREFRDDDYADVYKFERWYESFKSADFNHLFVKNFLPNNTVVYRSHTLMNKHFREDIGYEDWVFLLDVIKDYSISYLPVRGVVVHKMDYNVSHSRGAKTRASVAETAVFVYRNFPVTNPVIIDTRKHLFAQMGMDYNLLVESDDEAELDNELELLVKQGGMAFEDAFNRGEAFVKENRIKTAIVFYEFWLKYHFQNQGRFFILHQVGYLYSRLGQFDRALSYFNNVLSIMPSFHRSRYSLAEALLRLNQLDEARAKLAWLLDPKNDVEKENKALFEAASKLLASIKP